MYLIAGLGNPSLKYKHTRHNAGFDALDFIAKQEGISVKKKKFLGLLGEGRIGEEKVFLLKPQTYMNASGESIGMAVEALGIDPTKELIVLVDDTALDYGFIRVRPRGSSGGHNGLKNINAILGTEDYLRVRIGVGKLPEGRDMIKHVLSRPAGEDYKRLVGIYPDVLEACKLLLSGQTDVAMNTFNGKQR